MIVKVVKVLIRNISQASLTVGQLVHAQQIQIRFLSLLPLL